MLADIDIDGDGTFSFEEFVQLMFNMGNIAEISEEQEEKELRDAFTVFDRNGRGYITNTDLRSILHSLGENLTGEESILYFLYFDYLRMNAVIVGLLDFS